MLRRLAREISDRTGAVTCLLGLERDELVRMILFERGSIVDEYLSVPEFYGPLPPGDVVGLAANPTVVSRLTGANPADVRRIAQTAPAPADLPPARELLARWRRCSGSQGAEHGWADAPRRRGSRPARARMKVLLLHAWPLDETMWELHADVLSQAGYDVMTPRLYGRGASIDDWAARILRDFDGPIVAGRCLDGRLLRARDRTARAGASREARARGIPCGRRPVRATWRSRCSDRPAPCVRRSGRARDRASRRRSLPWRRRRFATAWT